MNSNVYNKYYFKEATIITNMTATEGTQTRKGRYVKCLNKRPIVITIKLSSTKIQHKLIDLNHLEVLLESQGIP